MASFIGSSPSSGRLHVREMRVLLSVYVMVICLIGCTSSVNWGRADVRLRRMIYSDSLIYAAPEAVRYLQAPGGSPEERLRIARSGLYAACATGDWEAVERLYVLTLPILGEAPPRTRIRFHRWSSKALLWRATTDADSVALTLDALARQYAALAVAERYAILSAADSTLRSVAHITAWRRRYHINRGPRSAIVSNALSGDPARPESLWWPGLLSFAESLLMVWAIRVMHRGHLL